MTEQENEQSAALYLKADEALFRKKTVKMAWKYLVGRGNYSEPLDSFEMDYMISCAILDKDIITPAIAIRGMINQVKGKGACIGKVTRNPGSSSVNNSSWS